MLFQVFFSAVVTIGRSAETTLTQPPGTEPGVISDSQTQVVKGLK